MLSFYLSAVETEEERSLITKLYTEYEQKMYGAAYAILQNKHNAEDAVHEAFLRIINRISEISIHNERKTEALLIIIVRNIAFDMYDKNKRNVSFDALENEIEDDAFSEYRKLNEITAKEAINRLPMELRQVVVMHYTLDLDIKAIASAMGLSSSTVYRRLEEARKIMRAVMEEKEDGEFKQY